MRNINRYMMPEGVDRTISQRSVCSDFPSDARVIQGDIQPCFHEFSFP